MAGPSSGPAALLPSIVRHRELKSRRLFQSLNDSFSFFVRGCLKSQADDQGPMQYSIKCRITRRLQATRTRPRALNRNVRLLMTRLLHTEDRCLATTRALVGQFRGNLSSSVSSRVVCCFVLVADGLRMC